jgi:hypothetical protein
MGRLEQKESKTVEIGLRPAQMNVFRCDKRFRVLVAGRRFGKTHLALVELLRAAWGKGRTAWYIAPSYRQAKRIAWDRLKLLTEPYWAGKPNETDLSIRLQWGGVIALRGADQYSSLRGNGLDFVVLDEYASMKPECWTEVIRPALADRKGGALFIGTPEGADHLFERFEHAQKDEDWAAFQYTTLQGGNVTAEELASASRELDARLYRQEFEASFEGVAQGQAYYCFSRAETVKPFAYRPGLPLIWSLDFNVNPMCSVLAQRVDDSVHILDELILPDSNTVNACEAFLERTRHWAHHGPITVEVYGDASGYQRRTSGTGTDWSLIREFFARWKGTYQATVRAATSNPGVRDRVALVNSRLQSASGERRLFVDPRCRELIKDFERVCWQLDGTGRVTTELDKSDRARTHISDALGYYVAEAFAMRGKVGERSGRLM